jgi:GNAT superfamily N-acetyltransferase
VAEDESDGHDLQLELSAHPVTTDIKILEDGIERFNHSTPFNRDRSKIPLAVWLRRRGRVLGGAFGDTHYSWLYLSSFWVDEEVRGQGWGSRIIRLFEDEGLTRGCRAAWVDTYGFQAPSFYEKVGYQEFGRLEDFPPGSARHFYWKPLQ